MAEDVGSRWQDSWLFYHVPYVLYQRGEHALGSYYEVGGGHRHGGGEEICQEHAVGHSRIREHGCVSATSPRIGDNNQIYLHDSSNRSGTNFPNLLICEYLLLPTQHARPLHRLVAHHSQCLEQFLTDIEYGDVFLGNLCFKLLNIIFEIMFSYYFVNLLVHLAGNNYFSFQSLI